MMTLHIVPLFTSIYVLIALTTSVQSQLDFSDEPTEFNAVLSNMFRQGMMHLSENEHVKKAASSLSEELRLIQAKSKHDVSEDLSQNEWASSVDSLLETVESLLGEQGSSSSSSKEETSGRAKKELLEFFGEFELFKRDMMRGRVDYVRSVQLVGKFLSLISRRPLLRKSVARVIEGYIIIPEMSIDVEEVVNFVSQIVGFWNAPMGQKVIKPMIEKITADLFASEFDLRGIKPTLDALLDSVLSKKMLKQVKPVFDVGFKIAERVIHVFKKVGLDRLIKNFNPGKFTTQAKKAYIEIFLDVIKPLEAIMWTTRFIVRDVDSVVDVIDRYQNVPGTLDAWYRKVCTDNPVIKVKSIVTHIQRAVVVIGESRAAIVGLQAYPLKHPSDAIDSVNATIVAMEDGNRVLKEIWPLRGYLKYHVVVKRFLNIRKEVMTKKSRFQIAFAKTVKFQNLINDVRDMKTVFEFKKVFKDIKAILVSYPKYDFIVNIMDLLFGELGRMKEVTGMRF